ncbi:J domain-containing protein [Bordetella sp. LUAb4]|uniref:J domain-containing protein n=1 Tax=Bordetella sp. LUAb4 TaxID=2843195 RepID=UPI001E627810|nr:J domain-containing protein [Bordetella sp. LUAb4]
MNKASGRAVNIVAGLGQDVLSEGQETFNALTRQIDERRARLRSWEDARQAFHKKFVDDLLPLQRESTDLQVRMVHLLNDAFDDRSLTKGERLTLSDLIAEMAGRLVDVCDDAAVKAIYNMHGQSDHDRENVAEMEVDAAAPEVVLGHERSRGHDHDDESPDELLRRVEAEMQAREDARERARQQRQAARKKASPKQRAAQARQDAAQADLSKSIREVYRKLASALHPDREPDPQEQLRKTALMQRANLAYEKKDLLTLLELQLELEHITQQALNGISEVRLQHYNEILREQIAELDEEIRHVERGLRQAYGIPSSAELSPDTVLRSLQKEAAMLQGYIRDLAGSLRLFEDIGRLKDSLAQMKRMGR